MTPQEALMNDAGLRLAKAIHNDCSRHNKLMQMMMPDSTGGGRMLERRGSVCQTVEGVDELIPEDFLERRRYERTTLRKSRESLKGKVIIQNEDQAK